MPRRSAQFVTEGNATARKIEFIDLIVEHLTEGHDGPEAAIREPVIDIASGGPEQVFELPRVEKLVSVIQTLNESASA